MPLNLEEHVKQETAAHERTKYETIKLKERVNALETLATTSHVTMIEMALLLGKLAERVIALEAMGVEYEGYKH